MIETPVSIIIEVNSIPVKVFLLKEFVGKEKDFLPLLESTKFFKKKFIDPFLLTVIRPRRKTPGSPSTEDGSHNDGGIRAFLSQHGNQPLQLHQNISGGGCVVDVISPQLKQNNVRTDSLYQLHVKVVHLWDSSASNTMQMNIQVAMPHLSAVYPHPVSQSPDKAVPKNKCSHSGSFSK